MYGLSIDRHIYIQPLTILKVKVKVKVMQFRLRISHKRRHTGRTYNCHKLAKNRNDIVCSLSLTFDI